MELVSEDAKAEVDELDLIYSLPILTHNDLTYRSFTMTFSGFRSL